MKKKKKHTRMSSKFVSLHSKSTHCTMLMLLSGLIQMRRIRTRMSVIAYTRTSNAVHIFFSDALVFTTFSILRRCTTARPSDTTALSLWFVHTEIRKIFSNHTHEAWPKQKINIVEQIFPHFKHLQWPSVSKTPLWFAHSRVQETVYRMCVCVCWVYCICV